MKKPPEGTATFPNDRVTGGDSDREFSRSPARNQANSQQPNRPPVTLAGRRKLLAVRERETNRQLADAAHKCAERLRHLTAYLDRQINELTLPEQEQSLVVIGAALLRIEQEAQRQLPWLCRDGEDGL